MAQAHELSRANWRKSRRSLQGEDCVEVADLGSAVAVRDSKDPAGPALVFTAAAWRAFFNEVRA
ncbi:DUF397 domain-containing protein [Actinomadura scrupuli]|uniref:DUF397 domain-containing protein n=1 Tax=Actinomadura scrupuli TaxID=559629 RepID=UPI003D961491